MNPLSGMSFFTDAGLHDPKGKTVMLLGLDVLPRNTAGRALRQN